MPEYLHTQGKDYLIKDGVRRSKAAQMKGHTEIKAHIFGSDEKLLGTGYVPIANLLSPKPTIRMRIEADIRRWDKIWKGADLSPLPFSEIEIEETNRSGTWISAVTFEM